MRKDLQDIVRDLVARGKERGFVTFDELNDALPAVEIPSEQIEYVIGALSEQGIVFSDDPTGASPSDTTPISSETACERGRRRLETAVAALRHGQIRLACQLMDATLAELMKPFVSS